MDKSVYFIDRAMKKLLQINPVLRTNTSTGRIMQEIGELAMANGWESYIAYSYGRDGMKPCQSNLLPIGNKWDVALHGVITRLFDAHGLVSQIATQKLVKQIEELKPDVIHIHNIHGYFLNYQILFNFLVQSDIPVIWTIHDCWLYTGHCYYYTFIGCNKWQTGCGHCPQQRKFPASWLVDRSRRNYIDKEKAFTSLPKGLLTLVPVSEWMAGEMNRSFLSGCDIRVIHNGIDTDTFSPQDGSALLARYGLEGKHILLGVASIWSREKGLDDFLRLSTMLTPDECIVLVGVDEHTAKRLPANIIPIRRTENVRQLAQLYSVATAFVNPTWQDNYPTVNLESISCGTPVVTYRTGGSPESVTTQTGMVVSQGDVDALLRSVRQIEHLGKESFVGPCRQYALQHFRKEDRYKDYLCLYDEVMQKAR